MSKRFLFLSLTLLLTAVLWAQTPILGEWITVDDATGEQLSVVKIYRAQNGKYYGEIIHLFGENVDNVVCEACVGEDHNKPVIGLTIIRDMELKRLWPESLTIDNGTSQSQFISIFEVVPETESACK